MKRQGGAKSERSSDDGGVRRAYAQLAVGAALFALALALPRGAWELALFVVAYVAVGGDVVWRALRNIRMGKVFDENFLMTVATLGAFAIAEYPEAVAVMLFYQVGELFQSISVGRSRRSIVSLMDVRPDSANLKVEGGSTCAVDPKRVQVGQMVVVRPGERVPLDGVVVEGSSMVDTSALTGEPVPRRLHVGDEALGGFVNTSGGLLTLRVTKPFGSSTVSRILDLVQNAGARKAPTEHFITTFARYYTPAVVGAALLLAVVPPLAIPGAMWGDWVYRALIFLVISCPCALVISIPMGFFGGIGGASRQGVLVKGANFLESLNRPETVVFDKTGTLTRGVFDVSEVVPARGVAQSELLAAAAAVEFHSRHPIATSIVKAYGELVDETAIDGYEEIPGQGVRALVSERSRRREVLAGNATLMRRREVAFDDVDATGTVVHVAVDGAHAGYIVIADEVKADAAAAIAELKRLGVRNVVMLTGDDEKVAARVARRLGIDEVRAELLPDQKVDEVERLLSTNPNGGKRGGKLLFVGDGINDAPVLARADVGVAMGALGSDAAIEAADVVLMTDEPSKLATGIRAARHTRRIVWQNIAMALGVKSAALLLGAAGVATLWEAIVADVGVTVAAVLNSLRAMRVPQDPSPPEAAVSGAGGSGSEGEPSPVPQT